MKYRMMVNGVYYILKVSRSFSLKEVEEFKKSSRDLINLGVDCSTLVNTKGDRATFNKE
jgi:hypothetical protein